MFKTIMQWLNLAAALAIPVMGKGGAFRGFTAYGYVALVCAFLFFFFNFMIMAGNIPQGKIGRLITLWFAAKEKELQTKVGQ